jgi:putative sigma-54 modulation protein
MQIIIKSRQTQVTPKLREHIERKVQRLARLLDSQVRVEVTVTEGQTRSAKDRFSVQLALSGNGHPIRSEVSALNASTALDLVLDKVESQIGRAKGRQTTVRRHHTPAVKVLALSRSGALSAVEEADQENGLERLTQVSVEDEQNEQIWSRVTEIRSMPTQSMTDQEVIDRMERDGSAFYPFFNEETNSVNVMYRLAHGGYGLLVPAMN